MKTRFLALAAILLAFSCGDSGDDGNGSGANPTAAVQIAPINNSECTTGVSVSATQSKVTFEWNPAQNADSYFLYVKNLLTQTSMQYNAGAAVTYEVTLQKGVPYSWYVSSRREGATPTSSPIWKFYNAGEGIANYAPFPAELVSPQMSGTVFGSTVTLQWSATDLDNDIVNYKVYMDTNSDPTTLRSTQAQTSLANVNVNPNTAYYWKVVTTDSGGNSSTSAVFQFRTN